jgi:hypothetical protein
MYVHNLFYKEEKMKVLAILTLLVTVCSSNYGSNAFLSKQYMPVPYFLPYQFPNVQPRVQAPIIVRSGGSSFDGLAGKYDYE